MAIRDYAQQLVLALADEVVEVSAQESIKHPNGSVVHHAILPLLQQHNFEIISSLNPSNSSCIVQPKVLKQENNDSCGYGFLSPVISLNQLSPHLSNHRYYALYNVLNVAAAITSRSAEDAIAHLHKMNDRTRFWVNYTRLVKELKKRADSSKLYPWSKENIDSGITYFSRQNLRLAPCY